MHCTHHVPISARRAGSGNVGIFLSKNRTALSFHGLMGSPRASCASITGNETPFRALPENVKNDRTNPSLSTGRFTAEYPSAPFGNSLQYPASAEDVSGSQNSFSG